MQTRLNFETDSSVGNISSVSALDTVTEPRHRWYHFKEAFSPYLVEHALDDAKCKNGDLIIDPFSGSGTVSLSSAINEHKAIGFEVNPFLAFVSNTKLLTCKPETFARYSEKVLEGIEQGKDSELETFSTFSEAGGAKKWLFNQEVLRAFEGGWQITNRKKTPARDFSRLCLIGAAMDVSNATKDGKCLRYRKDWKNRSFGKQHFIEAFKKRINYIQEDIASTPVKKQETMVRLADFRNIDTNKFQSNKFKLCITSPPYLNSFDYTDVYRPELFLGKFVRSHEELQQLRLRTLRSHVQANWASPEDIDFGSHFTDSYEKIKSQSDTLWNPRIPEMIQAYFEDMKVVLKNLLDLAAPRASVWIVVSTSAYAGVEIPVDLIIADISSNLGWYLREVNVVRYLRRVSGQQWNDLSQNKPRPHLRESIIILDKTPYR